jgi:plastocyanin domain-containing protein
MRYLATMIAAVALATGCGGPDEGDAAPATEAAAATEAAPAAAAAPAEDVQVVRVAVQGSNYVFSPSTVQAGELVRLVFDPNGLPGCSSTVTLPDYDITKTIAEGDATIEFTPAQAGPVSVACSMNMFTGTLVAE